MASHRSLFTLAACLLPSFVAACGDDGQAPPAGPHYHFVVNKAFIPKTNTEAHEFGLDIGQAKSTKLDKVVDNQLGMVLATLEGMMFDIQTTIDTAINKGSIILLVDFQTKDFTNTSAAGVQAFLGANPMPAPCTDANDMTCGHHLTGTGMFTVDPASPDNASLAGKIIGGTFNGGPGNLTLQIALGGTMAITLNLELARAQATDVSDSGMTLIVAGAITQDQINNQVIPAVVSQLGPIIMRDCNMLTMPPDCGCASGSTGKTILGLFDTAPKDCMVSVAEVQNNSLIKSLLAPDVCAPSGTGTTCDAANALSIGLKVTAVKGGFTVDGETM
jgi:hypothetical protein